MPRREAGVSEAVLEVAERYAKKHPDEGLLKLSRGRRKHKERKENAMSNKKKPAASPEEIAEAMRCMLGLPKKVKPKDRAKVAAKVAIAAAVIAGPGKGEGRRTKNGGQE